MSTYDPTEELVRAMLARRADGPPPAWLLTSTMNRVVTTRQAGRRSWLALPERTWPRVALAATAVLLLAALVGGALAAGGLLDRSGAPEPTQPAGVVTPTVLPSPSVEPSISPAAPSPSPALTPRPAPGALAADTLAVVTKAGNDLRVKTAPGVGADSKRLTPLLKSGTRMLVISGPVPKDGYDWYQVRTQEGKGPPFGWVASGKDRAAWIKPTTPKCPGPNDDIAIAELDPIDLLVCYGDQAIVLHGIWLDGTDDLACPWAEERLECRMVPTWMRASGWLAIGEDGVVVAVPPDLASEIDRIPLRAKLTATVAADAPDAASCEIVDAAGRDVVPRSRAVIECRLTLVLQGLDWEQATLAPDSMASVAVDGLEVSSAPGADGGEPTSQLRQGALVYVDAGPTQADGGDWYAILPQDAQTGSYGWVPAIKGDRATLVPAPVDCAPMDDWAGFVGQGRFGRLVCLGPEPQRLDMWVQDLQAPRPDWSTACGAYQFDPSYAPGVMCEATPLWLATFSGLTVSRPGEMEEFAAYDPVLMNRSAFPTKRTWMQVTGSFERPESDECRARNQVTGEDVLPPAQASIYCRETFVITALEPSTTSP